MAPKLPRDKLSALLRQLPTTQPVKGAARVVLGALEDTGIAKVDSAGKIKVKKLGVAKAALRPRKTLTSAFGSAAARAAGSAKTPISQVPKGRTEDEERKLSSLPRVCEIGPLGDACGVAAIGRCAFCHRPFCMSHQARTNGSISQSPVAYTDQCSYCQAALFAQEYQKQEANRHDLSNWIEGVRRVPDRIERTLRAFAPPSADRRYLIDSIIEQTWPDPPERAANEIRPRELPWVSAHQSWYDSAPWDSTAVAQWFVARALELKLTPEVEVRIKRWSKSPLTRKWVSRIEPHRPAWCFVHGSTRCLLEGKEGRERGKHYSALVFGDGSYAITDRRDEIVLDDGHDDMFGPESGGLNAEALCSMASILGLGRLQ